MPEINPIETKTILETRDPGFIKAAQSFDRGFYSPPAIDPTKAMLNGSAAPIAKTILDSSNPDLVSAAESFDRGFYSPPAFDPTRSPASSAPTNPANAPVIEARDPGFIKAAESFDRGFYSQPAFDPTKEMLSNLPRNTSAVPSSEPILAPNVGGTGEAMQTGAAPEGGGFGLPFNSSSVGQSAAAGAIVGGITGATTGDWGAAIGGVIGGAVGFGVGAIIGEGIGGIPGAIAGNLAGMAIGSAVSNFIRSALHPNSNIPEGLQPGTNGTPSARGEGSYTFPPSKQPYQFSVQISVDRYQKSNFSLFDKLSAGGFTGFGIPLSVQRSSVSQGSGNSLRIQYYNTLTWADATGATIQTLSQSVADDSSFYHTDWKVAVNGKPVESMHDAGSSAPKLGNWTPPTIGVIAPPTPTTPQKQTNPEKPEIPNLPFFPPFFMPAPGEPTQSPQAKQGTPTVQNPIGEDGKIDPKKNEQVKNLNKAPQPDQTTPPLCQNDCLADLQRGNRNNQEQSASSNNLLQKLMALLTAIQTFLQGIDFGLLSKIFDTVGRVETALGKLSEWLHLDRLLNLLTFIVTLQNAYFLCDSLKIVTLQMIADGLNVLGIKDKDGNTLNLNKIIDDDIEALLKKILGEETLKGFKAEWKALNRIYQAGSNIIYATQNMVWSVLGALEVIGSWNAQLGNALKKYGVIGQNAMAWMNPTPNFHNKFFTAVFNAQNIVNNIDFVAQSIINGRQAIDEIGKQSEEINKDLAGLSDPGKSNNGNVKPPEHKPTAEAQASSAAHSHSPTPSEENINSI